MAAQKVLEDRQAAESTRPKESAREVIWEFEVRELSNKETVPSVKYPIIRSVSIPRPGVCCLLLGLKNIMEQRGVRLVCILVHLTLIGQIDKRLFLFYHLLKFHIARVSLITEKPSSSELTVQCKFYHLLAM